MGDRAGALPALLGLAAGSAVETQRILDRRFTHDLRRHLRDRERIAPCIADALAPPRQQVTEQTLDLSVALVVRRTHGVEIGARVLEAGYAVRYGTTRERESRITITVEQVPLDGPSYVHVQPGGD